MSDYPFELWFDGRLHILYRDVDFTGTTLEMKSILQQAALFLGAKIEITVTANSIMVRAIVKS